MVSWKRNETKATNLPLVAKFTFEFRFGINVLGKQVPQNGVFIPERFAAYVTNEWSLRVTAVPAPMLSQSVAARKVFITQFTSATGK